MDQKLSEPATSPPLAKKCTQKSIQYKVLAELTLAVSEDIRLIFGNRKMYDIKRALL